MFCLIIDVNTNDGTTKKKKDIGGNNKEKN